MKTLIVEGELMSQCVVAKLLSERGHETVCFENAEQAVLAYQKEFYPLVFVDVDLPGMGGLQFCKWLRSQPEGDKTYILLAHSLGEGEALEEMLASGASDFLPKPLEVGSLKLRLDVAHRQMAGFFREKELETELNQKLQEADGLQVELCRAGESLVKEVEERRRAEDELEGTKTELIKARDAFDDRLKEQAGELCVAADQLQSVTSFRLKVEHDLKRVRSELESQAGAHKKELEALRTELTRERTATREEGERRLREGEANKQKLQELADARRKAEERCQASESANQKSAESFVKAKQEWERRQADLVAQLRSLQQQLETEGEKRESTLVEQLTGECEALREQLTSAREEFARRMEVHTTELMRLDEAMQEAMQVRQQVEADLVESREELAQKAKDYTAAVMKASEEVEGVSVERQRAREAYDQERQDLQRTIEELQGARGRAEVEREELEQELQKAWQELETRPAGPPEADPAEQEKVAELRERLEAEQGQNRQLLTALQNERTQVQERLRRFAAALEPSEPELISAS